MCKFLSYTGFVFAFLQIHSISGDLSIDQIIRAGNRKLVTVVTHRFDNVSTRGNGIVAPRKLTESDIRLVGGRSELEGRVEIRYNNVWGTVCDDGFNRNAAKVVCHMLGYQREGAVGYSRARFGKGKGPILLDELRCYGNEKTLYECAHSPVGVVDCGHKEDVGVKCRSTKAVSNRREVQELDLIVEGSERNRFFQRNKGNDRIAVNDPTKVWTKTIPYILGKGVDAEIGRAISDALDEWEAYTCLDFINDVRNTHYNKIVFTANQDNEGCASFYVGMQQASQEIHLRKDCLYREVILHEVGHALGLYHEHNRADRDRYIKIHFENIEDGKLSQFEKWPKDHYDDFNKPYDYKSIMHYGELFFSKNESQKLVTIETLRPEFQDIIGKAKHPSFLDYKIVNLLYQCSDACDNVQCPAGGYLGKNCRCYCEGMEEHTPVTLCYQEKDCPKPVINRYLFESHDKRNETVIDLSYDSYPHETVINVFSTNLNCNVHSEFRCDNGTWIGQLPDCPVDLGLELSGGSNDEGIIEVILNGQYGTICDDDWDDNDATVACRMMGFEFGKVKRKHNFRINESLPILIDELKCSGEETSLSECSHSGWGNHDCEYTESAAVKCFATRNTEQSKVTDGRSKCGMIPLELLGRNKRELRITGGVEALKGMHPWQVAIQIKLKHWIHWCGGTIIDKNWILTAAHCLDDVTIKRNGINTLLRVDCDDLRILAGDHDRAKRESNEQSFRTEYCVNHWKYIETDGLYAGFDIALIKIQSESGDGMVFNDYVQPACIPEGSDQVEAGIECEVSGWGKLSESGDISVKLNSAKVSIVDDEYCKELYKQYPLDTSRTVCAGDVTDQTGVDSCQGDSGGPLICNITGRNTVMGITSWGEGCGRPDAPGVYTRVSKFVSWIIEQIQLHDAVDTPIIPEVSRPAPCSPPLFNAFATRSDDCVRCFCFGHTAQCFSSDLQLSRIALVNQIQFTRREFDGEIVPIDQTFVNFRKRTGEYQGHNLTRALPPGRYYWQLPREFVGERLTSYGGEIKYTITYEIQGHSQSTTSDADVVMSGNGITLFHRNRTVPSPGVPTSVSVLMLETAWERTDSTRRRGNIPVDTQYVTRENFMTVLQNVEYILIRATYDRTQTLSRIGGVFLTTAVDYATEFGQAYLVEECTCPTGYTGLSCEDCAQGFTRIASGPYLGQCVSCNCNGHSSDCDPIEGQCLNCQHNTEGDSCEMCVVGFYGDATQGRHDACHRCPCPLTESPNQFSPTCILETDGQVTCTACPAGHTGRRCETCVQRYSGNPLMVGDYCRIITRPTCDCDSRGKVPNTQCDEVTQQCQCKEYVQGVRCTRCREEHFYLESDNPKGCLTCFCSGITNQCTSSNYYRDSLRPVLGSDGRHTFVLINRRMNNIISDGFVVDSNRNQVTFNQFEGVQQERESLFFQLPAKFIGDRVTSYGGYLRFTLEFSARPEGRTYKDVDLEVISTRQALRLYHLFEPGLQEGRSQTYEILLTESSFNSMRSNTAPTHDTFMTILSNIASILIRATYHQNMASVTLRDVSMDTAVATPTNLGGAPMVEVCRCPEGYTGLSCQRCADGYLRVSDGRGGVGRCVRCNCNGHATSCDPKSWRCLECQHNTEGDRCEICATGFYGDATSGSPNDCRACPCPLTTSTNQFSGTCQLAEDNEVTCDRCPTGYTGRQCEICADGYVGDPNQPGGSCSRADIDLRPGVAVSPLRVVEPEGSTVVYLCRVSGEGPFNVVWSRQDSRQLPDRATVSPRYTLTIRNLERDDTGRYICTATNRYGVTRREVELMVIYDIDECMISHGICVNGVCVNTPGAFRCKCNQGYTAVMMDKKCMDINECEDNPSLCRGGTCINEEGSYRCKCPDGLELSTDGTECHDIDECMISHGICVNGVCVNTPGAFRCECNQGYTSVMMDKMCIDMNECEDNPSLCRGGDCTNEEGGYRCKCPDGFELSTDSSECQEINLNTQYEFAGDGFMELPKDLLPHEKTHKRQKISFNIRTTQRDGLIFWQGDHGGRSLRGGDHIYLGLKGGYIEFSFDLGSGPATIVSRKRVDDGQSHTVFTERHGRSGALKVDNDDTVYGDSQGFLQRLNADGNIYIGGVSLTDIMTDGKFTNNFIGCIGNVNIHGRGPIESRDALSGYNVQTCSP